MLHENVPEPSEAVPPRVSGIGYAPSSLKSPMSLPQRIAIAMLVVSGVLYSIVCIPSYSRSPWPPIYRLWEATPWLWVFPIPIFALFMPGGSSARKALFLYALLTGFIDAWTFPFVSMNPHPSFDLDLWFANLLYVVPIHLAMTVFIALLSRIAYYFLDVSPSPTISPRSRRYRWTRIALLVGIIVIAAIFPFSYRNLALNSDAMAGARWADADWASQRAGIFSNDTESFREIGGVEFVSFFDTDSGLPLKQSWMKRSEGGYNAEIRKLIRKLGVPTWSLKSRFVTDADMLRMLTATDMNEITSYPCVLSPNLVLFRGGGVTPWGQSIGSNSKYLDIESRNQNFLPIAPLGEEKDPAFVGQLPKYPGTFFVRCGKSVVACTADGWKLQYLSDGR